MYFLSWLVVTSHRYTSFVRSLIAEKCAVDFGSTGQLYASLHSPRPAISWQEVGKERIESLFAAGVPPTPLPPPAHPNQVRSCDVKKAFCSRLGVSDR